MITNRKRPPHTKITQDNPYYKMTFKGGYISRARLNMAEHLGRCIGSDEYIYFKDGDCFNEDVGNLLLVSHQELNALHKIRSLERTLSKVSGLLKFYIDELEKIRFNKTPCNCKKCKLSHEIRQASYRL